MIDYAGDRDLAMGLARAYAPFKTGNLRFNALHSEMTADGFVILYSMDEAFYVYFLEEGTQKSKKYVGFISNRTVPAIASLLNAKYNIDKDVFAYYKEKSNEGHQDIFTQKGNEKMLIERGKTLQESLNLNVPQLAEERGWQHNESSETYYKDFAKIKF